MTDNKSDEKDMTPDERLNYLRERVSLRSYKMRNKKGSTCTGEGQL